MVVEAIPDLVIETLTGSSLLPFLTELARLRITVFRDWPYLYEGDEAYERQYLATYAHSSSAAVIIARVGGDIIGASTCLSMQEASAAVRQPFRDRGLDVSRFFYFGESVLIPAFRGRGLGVAFFAAREGHAQAVSGADYTSFCAVQRPAEHPLKPPDAVTLDRFWRKRGYQRCPGLVCQMTWCDHGDAADSVHDLTFWMKSISGAALPVATD